MKHRISVWVGALAWCVAALVAPAGAQEKIELGMNLTPGESTTMQILIDQDINQDMMGQEIVIDQVIGFTMRFDVLDRPADSGGQWVEVTYTRTQFKQNGPMGGVDYDSDNPPADIPLAARGVSGLVGHGFTLEMSPEGEAVQIEGVAELMENMIAAMDLPDGPAKKAATDMMKTQLNEDSLKQMMSMSSAMFPPGPVTVGDSWEDTQSIGGMMPMTITSAYELLAWDDDTATLDTTGRIAPNPDAEPFDLNDMQVDSEMTGTQSGQVVLDRHTGWTRSSSIEQEMEGGMTIIMANGGTMEIDMTIKGTVEIKLLD